MESTEVSIATKDKTLGLDFFKNHLKTLTASLMTNTQRGCRNLLYGEKSGKIGVVSGGCSKPSSRKYADDAMMMVSTYKIPVLKPCMQYLH